MQVVQGLHTTLGIVSLLNARSNARSNPTSDATSDARTTTTPPTDNRKNPPTDPFPEPTNQYFLGVPKNRGVSKAKFVDFLRATYRSPDCYKAIDACVGHAIVAALAKGIKESDWNKTCTIAQFERRHMWVPTYQTLTKRFFLFNGFLYYRSHVSNPLPVLYRDLVFNFAVAISLLNEEHHGSKYSVPQVKNVLTDCFHFRGEDCDWLMGIPERIVQALEAGDAPSDGGRIGRDSIGRDSIGRDLIGRDSSTYTGSHVTNNYHFSGVPSTPGLSCRPAASVVPTMATAHTFPTMASPPHVHVPSTLAQRHAIAEPTPPTMDALGTRASASRPIGSNGGRPFASVTTPNATSVLTPKSVASVSTPKSVASAATTKIKALGNHFSPVVLEKFTQTGDYESILPKGGRCTLIVNAEEKQLVAVPCPTTGDGQVIWILRVTNRLNPTPGTASRKGVLRLTVSGDNLVGGEYADLSFGTYGLKMHKNLLDGLLGAINSVLESLDDGLDDALDDTLDDGLDDGLDDPLSEQRSPPPVKPQSTPRQKSPPSKPVSDRPSLPDRLPDPFAPLRHLGLGEPAPSGGWLNVALSRVDNPSPAFDKGVEAYRQVLLAGQVSHNSLGAVLLQFGLRSVPISLPTTAPLTDELRLSLAQALWLFVGAPCDVSAPLVKECLRSNILNWGPLKLAFGARMRLDLELDTKAFPKLKRPTKETAVKLLFYSYFYSKDEFAAKLGEV